MALNLDLAHLGALVTGGARGIGRAIACSLARAGTPVAIADIDQQQGRLVADELRAMGHEAVAVQLDVTDMDSVTRCAEEAIRRIGHVDVLVNNAGIFQSQLGFELQDRDFNRCLDINLTGIWRLTKALMPHFKARGGGKIINIASISGRRGNDVAAAYCASKAAVINLTQSLAAALGPDNINVNAVCPGAIATDMYDSIRALLAKSPFESRLHATQTAPIPLAGPLTPEDIGNAVVFLASEYARNITGQALNIDRGELMN